MSQPEAHQQGLTPEQTIHVIDALLKTGRLTEDMFKEKHHMHHATRRFKAYCETIRAFQPNSKNRCLANWLGLL